jgi:hypothetical protein
MEATVPVPVNMKIDLPWIALIAGLNILFLVSLINKFSLMVAVFP